MPKIGVQRLIPDSQKPAIGGPFCEYQGHSLQVRDCLAGAGGFEPPYGALCGAATSGKTSNTGHRMVPTHATKAGIRYRYYVSTPVLHGEAKTASAGSASRVPAADIEEVIVNSLKDHLAIQQAKSTTNPARIDDRGALAQLVARITVHKDKLTVRLKSDDAADASNSADGPLLTITWQKQPSRRSRQILLPHKSSRSQVRPQQSERRARLVSAIARGRRWLDEVVSGRVTSVDELCAREKCSVRQVNMTISLAFLAPNLVKAAVEGHPPRGIGIERFAICRLNGAGNLRRSDSIRNS
jgi:hypothetical protein